MKKKKGLKKDLIFQKWRLSKGTKRVIFGHFFAKGFISLKMADFGCKDKNHYKCHDSDYAQSSMYLL